MRRISFPFLLLGALAFSAAGEPAVLGSARKALAEALPGIALTKLRAALAVPDFPAGDRPAAVLLLGQALCAAGWYEEAEATILPLRQAHEAKAELLQAEILAATGRWAEARPLFHTLAGEPGAPVAAAAGEAEALAALGRTDEAVQVWQGLARSGRATPLHRLRWAVLLMDLRRETEARAVLAEVTPATPEARRWKEYAEARLLLLQDQAAPALRAFEELTKARDFVPETLLVAATLGEAEAKLVLQGTQEADDVLENFIWQHPSGTHLEEVFSRLDQIYAQEEDPNEAELRKWSQKPEARRAALATFYLGQAQARGGRWEKAGGTLARFLSQHPKHPLAPEAGLLLAETWVKRQRLEEAAKALEAARALQPTAEMRGQIEFRLALVRFQQGQHEAAGTLFDGVAQRSGELRAVATFDAALSALYRQQFDRFTELYRSFVQLQPESPLRAELTLEQGLVEARAGDERAPETLQTFLRDFPRSPRRAEARLALAETRFLSGEANASELLPVSQEGPAAPEMAAQADYLQIFLQDAQPARDDAKTIALGRRFLQEHAAAPQAAEVRMKLGQIFYRREDYANAETLFAQVAEGAPGSYTEAALFLAARSALRLINAGAVDRALDFLDRVVKLEGPLRLYARQEQAAIQSRLEHEDQAIALYDLILASPQVDAELWQAALCGKGDNLAAQGRRALPEVKALEQAVAVYSQLAASPRIRLHWRNQALYKKAKALELMGRGEESLVTFYEVLEGTTGREEREFFWFYKAGFDAARVYEQQENWKSAIGIYLKMVKLDGPRTAEAQSRLRQVRLEHFIWE